MSRGRNTSDRNARRELVLIAFAVVLLELLIGFGLREAMRPHPAAENAVPDSLQITFIERPVAPPVPISRAEPRPIVSHAERAALPSRLNVSQVRVGRALPPASPPDEALRAVSIAPNMQPIATTPPSALLHDQAGRLNMPPAGPSPRPPRDLLAHRSVDYMLPGGPSAHSVDFHVSSGTSPEEVVNRYGRMASGLIAAASRPQLDGHGDLAMQADRGMRTSDRDTDPCQDIAQDMVNLDDAKVREQAEERYQQSCEGH